MANKAIYNINAIDIDDLAKSSATMEYPVGAKITIKDSSSAQPGEYIYVKAHSTLTQYAPYGIEPGSGGNAEVVTAAPATIASGAIIGFALAAITSRHYCWLQLSGVITAAAGTVAAGDHVEVLNTGTTVTVDGSTGSTVNSIYSIGIAKTATSGGTITLAVLPSRTVAIQSGA